MQIRAGKGNMLGLTKIEVLVIVSIGVGFFALAIWVLNNARNKAQRIRCVSYQKQITLAFRMWSNDHQDNFPFSISTNKGGTKECIGKGLSFIHFLAISNELGSPFILTCLKDERKSVRKWSQFSQSNLSYFVNIYATEKNPQSILTGDRNLTNLQAAENGLWQLSTNPPTFWTPEIHGGCGNVGLADGSVQQMSSSGLFKQILLDPNTLRRIELP